MQMGFKKGWCLFCPVERAGKLSLYPEILGFCLVSLCQQSTGKVISSTRTIGKQMIKDQQRILRMGACVPLH